MATLGLAFVTVTLATLGVRSQRIRNKATLAAFWTGYAIMAGLFAGVL